LTIFLISAIIAELNRHFFIANFLGRNPSDITYLIRKIDDKMRSDQVRSNQLDIILKILKA
jgi:hypothetical protein